MKTHRFKTATSAILAILFVSIAFIFASRACCSGVSLGMVPISRLQAKGEMQFERTL